MVLSFSYIFTGKFFLLLLNYFFKLLQYNKPNTTAEEGEMKF